MNPEPTRILAILALGMMDDIEDLENAIEGLPEEEDLQREYYRGAKQALTHVHKDLYERAEKTLINHPELTDDAKAILRGALK